MYKPNQSLNLFELHSTQVIYKTHEKKNVLIPKVFLGKKKKIKKYTVIIFQNYTARLALSKTVVGLSGIKTTTSD